MSRLRVFSANVLHFTKEERSHDYDPEFSIEVFPADASCGIIHSVDSPDDRYSSNIRLHHCRGTSSKMYKMYGLKRG